MLDVSFLEHVGVLGMHWGIRKKSAADAQKESPNAQRDRVQKLKKKKVSELTDDELKELTTRLQLEKQLKDISPSKVNTGQKFLSEVLTNSGKQVATTYATKYMGLGVETLIGSLTGKPISANVIKEAVKEVTKEATSEAAKAAVKSATGTVAKEVTNHLTPQINVHVNVPKSSEQSVKKQESSADLVRRESVQLAIKKAMTDAGVDTSKGQGEEATRKALLKAGDLAISEAIRLNRENIAKEKWRNYPIQTITLP